MSDKVMPYDAKNPKAKELVKAGLMQAGGAAEAPKAGPPTQSGARQAP